ncbi:hypothetical protein [Delftia lacustris]|uniref:Uncharacterized protein n=1 Tax=Delftia lacustris TaxID=558537 RepID=A0A1H3KR58_9BURK|nr:hypothetical protein [Delftia lacustris]SDY54621.1 hypothetical protein SAMN05421547_105285 [Delftia lacustris]
MLSTTAWENHVLAFDPFDGDFGDQGDRVLSNKLVTARKPGPCAHCGCQIAQGERVRSMSARFDGQLMSYRWCALCCEAMAKCDVGDDSGDDSDDRDAWQDYEDRAGLAAKRATAQAAAKGSA